MFDEKREAARIFDQFDSHTIAWLRAIARLPIIRELPESEEAIEKWIDEHPEKADLLGRTLTNITQEFSLHIAPQEDNQE